MAQDALIAMRGPIIFLKTHLFTKKHLYFDEVENANVWSFYLVDRDLHHTFEEFLVARGLDVPHAIWSRPDRENSKDDIGRATFPIAEVAAIYKCPVPKAGDILHYVIEVIELNPTSAVFGFLGYLLDANGKRNLKPSVVAAWLRVFVKYVGNDRNPGSIPASLRKILEEDLKRSGFRWQP